MQQLFIIFRTTDHLSSNSQSDKSLFSCNKLASFSQLAITLAVISLVVIAFLHNCLFSTQLFLGEEFQGWSFESSPGDLMLSFLSLFFFAVQMSLFLASSFMKGSKQVVTQKRDRFFCINFSQLSFDVLLNWSNAVQKFTWGVLFLNTLLLFIFLI